MLSFPPVVMAPVAVFLSFDGELDTQPWWGYGEQASARLPSVLHPFSHSGLLFLHYHPQGCAGDQPLKDPGATAMCHDGRYLRWQAGYCW